MKSSKISSILRVNVLPAKNMVETHKDATHFSDKSNFTE